MRVSSYNANNGCQQIGGSTVSTRGGGSQRRSGTVGDPSARRPIGLAAALRRAWIGYQQRLDQEMATAGFSDRSLPDGRVLRLCAESDQVTASQIGRELGITRQGAGKIVAALQDRGYVTVAMSSSDAREKVLRLTSTAREYLAAQRAARRRIERDLRRQVGDHAYETMTLALDALGREDQPRMRDYLRGTLRDTEANRE
jgi:DNA-binding MarR family transcriptional regulator